MTTQPSIVFLNSMGHIEMSWDEKDTERTAQVRAMIEKKMAEGVRFFIVKPKMLGLLKGTTEVTKTSQVTNTVSFDDEDLPRLGMTTERVRIADPVLAKLAQEGVVKFTRREGNSSEQIGVADTVEKVLTNRTVATTQLRGG